MKWRLDIYFSVSMTINKNGIHSLIASNGLFCSKLSYD